MTTTPAALHAAHRDAIAHGRAAAPGVVAFVPSYEMPHPDGTVHRWGDHDELVALDVLLSTGTDRAALERLARRLHDAFLTLTQDPDDPGTGRRALLGGASLEWREVPSAPALEARIVSGGEDGLDSAEAACDWLIEQCGTDPRLTITVGEEWTELPGR